MVEIEVDVNSILQRLAGLQVTQLQPLAGGASSLTYLAQVEGGRDRLVVKVAPAGLMPTRNRDVLRQARVIRALAGPVVPVPEVVWEDAGAPPEVPPLFAMTFIEGTSLEPLFDEGGTDEPGEVAARLLDAARVLGAMHAVTPEALSLGDEPVVDLDDEVERWCRALETVDQGLVEGWRAVASALRGAAPAAVPAALVHGDYRLGNLLAVGHTVTAVIDWEIWALGDPRVDLGWFLLNADPATYGRATPYVGRLPGLDELVSTYVDAAGRPVEAVAWFHALAAFKATATWSLIIKHARHAETSDAVVASVPRLLRRAVELLG